MKVTVFVIILYSKTQKIYVEPLLDHLSGPTLNEMSVVKLRIEVDMLELAETAEETPAIDTSRGKVSLLD